MALAAAAILLPLGWPTTGPVDGRSGTAAGSHVGGLGAAQALELQGQTWFAQPPWRVELRNYYSNVFDSGAEYYFSLTLPPGAGVGLGGLVIIQTHGIDRTFSFDQRRSRAFLGLPRREGPPVAVQLSFDDQARRWEAVFPEPPAPGQTITLALRPWHNPNQADTYQFAVQALPAGPNPVPASLGFARLPIYEGLLW